VPAGAGALIVPVTVAVIVTLVPKLTAAEDTVTVAVGVAFRTVSPKAPDVAGSKSEIPL
jgi:hypothetical protein